MAKTITKIKIRTVQKATKIITQGLKITDSQLEICELDIRSKAKSKLDSVKTLVGQKIVSEIGLISS